MRIKITTDLVPRSWFLSAKYNGKPEFFGEVVDFRPGEGKTKDQPGAFCA